MMKHYRLGEICNIVSGGTPSRSNTSFWEGGTIPWIKIGNISQKYVNTADEYITQEGLDGSSAKMLPSGTILYTIFATLGEVGILSIDACTNQAIAGLTIRNPEQVRTDYIYYYLKSRKVYVSNLGRGVAQNNINMSILRDFDVPLPSIEQQDEIITVLEKTSAVIEGRKEELGKLDDLIKARFVELFGDPLINPKGFPVRTIDEVSVLNKGITYSPEDVADEGIIVLRSSNIQGNTFDLNDLVKITKKVSPDKYVQENDILMCNRNGSARLVGKVAKIPKLNEDMTFGTFMTIVRSDIHEYLFAFFQMDAFREQIKFQTAVAINQISLPLLASVKVPIPPIELIEEFTAFTEQVDKSKVVEISEVA